MRRGDIYPMARAERALCQLLPPRQPHRPPRARPAARLQRRRPHPHHLHGRPPHPRKLGVRERVLVCISSSPTSRYLIARGARIAPAAEATFVPSMPQRRRNELSEENKRTSLSTRIRPESQGRGHRGQGQQDETEPGHRNSAVGHADYSFDPWHAFEKRADRAALASNGAAATTNATGNCPVSSGGAQRATTPAETAVAGCVRRCGGAVRFPGPPGPRASRRCARGRTNSPRGPRSAGTAGGRRARRGSHGHRHTPR